MYMYINQAYTYTQNEVHVHVIVVSWFLQCMGDLYHTRAVWAEPEEVQTAGGWYYPMHHETAV